MNLQEIKELIKLVDQSAIAELSLEAAGVKVAIRKSASGAAGKKADITLDAGMDGLVEIGEFLSPSCLSQEEVKELCLSGLAKPEAQNGTNGLLSVRSPLVGTFYRAPAPDAPPFVQVGDVVQKGQVLCIIEAMKMMNEIESEFSGKIVDILVENGQVVEYGQELFLIQKM